MNTLSKTGWAMALAATIVTGSVVSTWAADLPVDSGAMAPAESAYVVPVRWGGRGWGPGLIVGGVAAGFAGAAIAGAYGPYGYYGGYGGYGPYAYDSPGYYGPGPYYGGPYRRYRHWQQW